MRIRENAYCVYLLSNQLFAITYCHWMPNWVKVNGWQITVSGCFIANVYQISHTIDFVRFVRLAYSNRKLCNVIFFCEWVDWLNKIKMNKPFIDFRFINTELIFIRLTNYNHLQFEQSPPDDYLWILISRSKFNCSARNKTYFVFRRAVEHQ